VLYRSGDDPSTLDRMVALDWNRLENGLYGELRAALERFGRAHPEERVYAVALYGVYRELDGLLSLPHLALAREEGSAPPDTNGFWGARYNPEDWTHTELEVSAADTLLLLERALTAEATRGAQAHWRKTEARYFRVLVRITRRLRDEAPSLVHVTDDFVCYWHDEEGGPDLAAKTIPRARFARLFAPEIEHGRQLAALAEQPLEARITFLVSRFGKFEGVTSEDAQRELLAIGEPALSALTRALTDRQHGWAAARLLGQIGVPRADVIDALRSQAAELWCATALGMLGDHAWLGAQGSSIAARGLTARLKAIASGRVRHALDYRPLERFLDGASQEERALVRAELEPGRSYASIAPTDVDEALRGLSSEHPVVRWHAASRLADRGLGARAGKKILPALGRGLADPDPTVRRLVVLSISYWKAAAAPYRGAIEALREDPDELVRRIVQHALSQG